MARCVTVNRHVRSHPRTARLRRSPKTPNSATVKTRPLPTSGIRHAISWQYSASPVRNIPMINGCRSATRLFSRGFRQGDRGVVILPRSELYLLNE